MTVGSNT